jgi:hypothetical protein
MAAPTALMPAAPTEGSAMNQISRVEYKGRAYEFEYLEKILSKAIGYDIDLSADPKTDNVAVVSKDPRKLKPLLDSAAQAGLTIEQINPGVLAEKFDIFIESMWASIFVCVDDCGGIGAVFETLRRFRNAYPKTPIILISSDFSKDDLSCERLPLADVSLKAPLSAGRMDEALKAAFLNNVIWQSRIQDLGQNKSNEDLLEVEDARVISYETST